MQRPKNPTLELPLTALTDDKALMRNSNKTDFSGTSTLTMNTRVTSLMKATPDNSLGKTPSEIENLDEDGIFNTFASTPSAQDSLKATNVPMLNINEANSLKRKNKIELQRLRKARLGGDPDVTYKQRMGIIVMIVVAVVVIALTFIFLL